MNVETSQDYTLTSTSPESGERHSPGALIRRARERARLAPEELAAQTKLSRSVLDALERDDFNTLNEQVYVRGYYRKCAKVLDIPESELLRAYEATVAPRAPQAPAKLRLASGTDLGTGSRLPVSLAVVGAIGAVILCALIWFARGEPSSTVPPAVSARADAIAPESQAQPIAVESASSLPMMEAPTASQAVVSAPVSMTTVPATTPAPAAHTTPAATVVPAATVMPTAPVVATPTPTTAPTAATPAPLAAPSAKPVAGAIAVTLDFTITSWARVDDASGKTLLNGLMRAGDKQTLSGAAPFMVFLGNAPGVKASVNGKAVDLAKYTTPNNTARFSLSGN